MKIYCIECKYYTPLHIGQVGGLFPPSCGAPQNYKDTYVAPRSTLKQEPYIINKKNNCKFFIKKLSIWEKIRRFFS